MSNFHVFLAGRRRGDKCQTHNFQPRAGQSRAKNLKPNLTGLLAAVVFLAIMSALAQFAQAQSKDLILLDRQIVQIKGNLSTLKSFQKASQGFYSDIGQLYPDLPGLSTARIDFYQSLIHESILTGDYPGAYRDLNLAQEALQSVLADQDRIIREEINRLNGVVSESLVTAEGLFINPQPWKARHNALVKNLVLNQERRMGELRALQMLEQELAQAIFLRRLQSDQSVKSIVVKKSELKMYLYEDEDLIYELPLSLGRPGFGTRSGQFKVLDKLGTVWGYWRIYLPYWMGIYFAGSSENGIHGLPWDKAGNVYWREAIGGYNATYGCVMGLNEDMARVYNWAELGTPVTIIN